MKIQDLLAELNYECVSGQESLSDIEITALCYDNRKCIPGCAFVAIRGAKFDGHSCARDAFEKGAALIVTEHEVDCDSAACVIRVDDTRRALSLLSAAWFGYPARKLTTVAITGTKGKSTTAYMVRNILNATGHKAGIIGTIGVGIGDKVYATDNTTPESYIVQSYLRQMVDEGCDSLVMEVSSQAMKMHRVAGIMYDYAIYTNLEPDHIGENEHADFNEYMYCKSLLFRNCLQACGNSDDEHFESVVKGKVCAPSGWKEEAPVGCSVDSFGMGEGHTLNAIDVKLLGEKGSIGIGYHLEADGYEQNIELSIPGSFNVYNSLAALSVCRHILKKDASGDADRYAELMKKAGEALYGTHVLGRLEPLAISDRFSIMIDYAHNAMALESLLNMLKEYNPKRLVCLFGCGGNRSKERRYEMGEVSSRLADLSVITSDNPRFEKPQDIIDDIMIGVHKADGEYVMIPDRRDAIRFVIEKAQDGDVIVLAGKGNEDYQEIEGVKYHMDEREIVAGIVDDLMKERGYI